MLRFWDFLEKAGGGILAVGLTPYSMYKFNSRVLADGKIRKVDSFGRILILYLNKLIHGTFLHLVFDRFDSSLTKIIMLVHEKSKQFECSYCSPLMIHHKS